MFSLDHPLTAFAQSSSKLRLFKLKSNVGTVTKSPAKLLTCWLKIMIQQGDGSKVCKQEPLCWIPSTARAPELCTQE